MTKNYVQTVVREKHRQVIAFTQYHGDTVKATARCAPNDVFDPTSGSALAQARLEVKVTNKRLKYAENRLTELYDRKEALAAEIDKINAMIERTEANIDGLTDEVAEAEAHLEDVVTNL